MREIKFRAWDLEKKKMSGVFNLDDYAIDQDGEFGDCEYPSLSEDTLGFKATGVLMQFTGLKDKNGKEIYEGDVVETLEDGNTEVIFQDGMFGCVVERPQSNENGTEFYEEFISLNDLIDQGYWGSTDGVKPPEFTLGVIGNVWENPELLTSKS